MQENEINGIENIDEFEKNLVLGKDMNGKGSYWLKEANGKMLKTPQNGKNLKKYFERNQGEPRIVINGKEVYDRKKFKVSLVEN